MPTTTHKEWLLRKTHLGKERIHRIELVGFCYRTLLFTSSLFLDLFLTFKPDSIRWVCFWEMCSLVNWNIEQEFIFQVKLSSPFQRNMAFSPTRSNNQRHKDITHIFFFRAMGSYWWTYCILQKHTEICIFVNVQQLTGSSQHHLQPWFYCLQWPRMCTSRRLLLNRIDPRSFDLGPVAALETKAQDRFGLQCIKRVLPHHR